MSVFLLVSLPAPIIGTIVRYRASYYPKNKALASATASELLFSTAPAGEALNAGPVVLGKKAPAEGAEPEQNPEAQVGQKADGPVDRQPDTPVNTAHTSNAAAPSTVDCPPNFFRVMKKVWKEDQFEGLFKGIFPGAVFILLFNRAYVSPAPVTYFTSILTVLPVNFFYLFVLIATYRTIVTPHQIRLADPRGAYRLIFTEFERGDGPKALLGFLRYSGLIPAFLLMIFFEMLIYKNLYWHIGRVGPLFDLHGEEDWTKIITYPVWKEWVKVGAYWAIAIVATIFLAPLDVIVTRLAIQPVHGKPAEEGVAERDLEKLLDGGLAPPSSFNFTTEHMPYLNAFDCYKRTIDEEGWGALYRGWWLTFLGVMLPYCR